MNIILTKTGRRAVRTDFSCDEGYAIVIIPNHPNEVRLGRKSHHMQTVKVSNFTKAKEA